MHPILFEVGGFPVYTYGVLLAAAYLLGLQFALRRARTRGLDPNRVMDLGIWIIVSALVGAKLHPRLQAASSSSTCRATTSIRPMPG
jgi:phosphatidylglycerol:prolipoprotein diacylglycerol transferase